MCDNQSLHADVLENLVWEEVKLLLNNPYYLEKEYQRRIKELDKKSNKNECSKVNSEKIKLEKSISRLIDSYTDGIIEKSEFEPRIKSYKKRLLNVEQQLFQLKNDQTEQSELRVLIGRFEMFSASVKQKLEDVDWQMKRDIFEALIKQVEIGKENVNIIFRVSPASSGTDRISLLEDCRRSGSTCVTYPHF